MINPKCKICRRAGEKLFLKGERCSSAKCEIVKRNFPPGTRSKKFARRLSEYGSQLKEKQKMKNLYGMREKQFSNYFKEALKIQGVTADIFFRLLESRLDNTVFRAGFAESRSIARQMVSHGHFLVNGRKVTIPSYRVKNGDLISIRPQDANSKLFENTGAYLKKYNPPKWIELSKEKMQAKITSLPGMEDALYSGNPQLVIEYYSR